MKNKITSKRKEILHDSDPLDNCGTKTKKYLVYEGFGFPIYLFNVRLFKTRGKWIPDINHNELQREVLQTLLKKRSHFTGAELRFFRKYLKLSPKDFAKQFQLSTSCVIECEENEDDPVQLTMAIKKRFKDLLRSV